MNPHAGLESKSNKLAPGNVALYMRRALALVWSTSRRLTLILTALTLVSALLPAAIAYFSKLIIDAVILAADVGTVEARNHALTLVAIEGGLVAAQAASQRGISVCRNLLRALMGQRVNVMILEKAGTLALEQFEDSDFYDKLTRARREASSRPLSLVLSTFGLLQNIISLISYGVLLLQFSVWATVLVAVAGLPAFIAETRFSGEAFRLFRWRSPETRKQMYLESVAAREDYAKEVRLFQLGRMLIDKYEEIFQKVYAADRSLALRRGLWGYLLSLFGTAAFYGAYVWVAIATVAKQISLGDMAMYLALFRQGQSAVSASLSTLGSMYEDNLYLSTLYEFLEEPSLLHDGTQESGARPGDGVRFENVSFQYPGSGSPAVDDVSLHIKPGEKLALVGENGAGKTTLIKLLTRLYHPTSGRILLDGTDLREWSDAAVRRRLGVIFQDFARYQFLVGENIGAGQADHFDDRTRWQQAGSRGLADGFVQDLPKGYETQLGRWFRDGQEISGGQWQKVALSRLHMRDIADILILDEPTAAMDAEAEHTVFQQFRSMTDNKMAIVISHRFSTVRIADHIVVLDGGRIVEQGSHDELMDHDGRYARLFSLQAEGYL